MFIFLQENNGKFINVFPKKLWQKDNTIKRNVSKISIFILIAIHNYINFMQKKQ